MTDARTRLGQLFDDGEYETFSDGLKSTDPLKFVDLKPYAERLTKAQEETGLNDAVIKALGRIHALLDSGQRAQLAYLIRTGVLSL